VKIELARVNEHRPPPASKHKKRTRIANDWFKPVPPPLRHQARVHMCLWAACMGVRRDNPPQRHLQMQPLRGAVHSKEMPAADPDGAGGAGGGAGAGGLGVVCVESYDVGHASGDLARDGWIQATLRPEYGEPLSGDELLRVLWSNGTWTPDARLCGVRPGEYVATVVECQGRAVACLHGTAPAHVRVVETWASWVDGDAAGQ